MAVSATRAAVAARPDRRLVLALLCAADVLVMLDGMVVTVALPSIQRDLGFSAAGLQWVVSAYTLTLGSFLLVGGRAADLFGRRRLLATGMLVFTAGSLAAGLAPSAAVLLAARAMQGLGAALSVPAAMAVVAATFQEGFERHRAIGILSGVVDVGMVAGLVLGGLITAALGWPWVFFLVVAPGLGAAALMPAVLEESRDEAAPRRLDVTGSVLVAAGCALLVLGVVQTEHHEIASAAVLGPLAGAATLLTAFAAVERRAASPVIRLGILRVRRLTGANLGIVANAGSFTGMMFLTTLYVQRELGLSAPETGLAFLPLALSAGAGGFAAPPLIERFGPHRVASAGLAITAAGFVALSESDRLLPVLAVFAVAGATISNAFVALSGQGLAGVREGEHGRASGLFQTSTHLGGAITVALLATIAAAAGFSPAYLAGAAVALLGAAAARFMLVR
jgi:EmrB/QacA subfamily drug resistance transporter